MDGGGKVKEYEKNERAQIVGRAKKEGERVRTPVGLRLNVERGWNGEFGYMSTVRGTRSGEEDGLGATASQRRRKK